MRICFYPAAGRTGEQKTLFDANGNTTSKTDTTGTTNYTWDFENRLTSVILPGSGGTVTFKYDPFGRRIYKQSPNAASIFIYDDVNLVETVNASGGVVARYAQGLNIDEPLAELRGSTADYYEADGLGSVTSVTDTTGALAETYTYDSFGNAVASTGTLRNYFQYAAREFDTETNLYFYRARYYDPTTGRFLSEDPIGFHAGVNKYAYVLNDPTKYRDPAGLWPWDGYYKAKALEAQAESDQEIYDMTSRIATDPLLIAKCQRGVNLAMVNQLAYANLEIDHVLAEDRLSDS